jgi:hypothetical protein
MNGDIQQAARVEVVGIQLWFDVQRSHGNIAAAGDFVGNPRADPQAPLGRHCVDAVFRDHRHHPGTGIQQLGSLVAVGRIHESRRVLVAQADYGPRGQEPVSAWFWLESLFQHTALRSVLRMCHPPDCEKMPGSAFLA